MEYRKTKEEEIIELRNQYESKLREIKLYDDEPKQNDEF
jgi:hypothetical protein